jgi:hypothetical protein
MKYVKRFVLGAIAAATLMALAGAGTASASMLCSAAESTCSAANTWPTGTEIDFSLINGGSSELSETGAEGETLNTCKNSTIETTVTNAGSSTATVTGNITVLTVTGCSWTTQVISGFLGKFEIHVEPNGNGTVTLDAETRMTISIPLFGSCVYGGTAGTDLGTITEGKGTGSIFHGNAVFRKLSGSSFTCPETALWKATYALTSPSNTTLYVSNA